MSKNNRTIVWSDYKDYQAERIGAIRWWEAVKLTAKTALERSEYHSEFERIMELFRQKANRFEEIHVGWWIYPFIYIEAKDTRWKHYPCGIRCCVSFDLTNGKIASRESQLHNAFARKGWGRFIDQLIGRSASRYHSCNTPEKKEHC